MRYSVLILFLLAVTSGWAQDTTRVKKMNTELSKIASQTKNNGKWIFIKPDQKIKSDDFLKNKKALNLSDKSSFKKLKATPLKDAYAMEKHQQYHNNIRIVDAITVIFTNNGNVERVQGDILEDKPESNTFKLTEKQVITKALEQLPSTEYAWQNDKLEADLKSRTKNPEATNYPQPEKVYFEKDGELYAGFELKVISYKPHFDYTLILDAENGSILSKINNVHNCFSRHKHEGNHNHSEEKTKSPFTNDLLSKKSNVIEIIDYCFLRPVFTSLYGLKTVNTYYTVYSDGTSSNLYTISNTCNDIEHNIWDFNNGNNRRYRSDINDFQSANTTLYGLQKTELYYKNKFNRLGWDNDNGDITVYQNAEFTRKDKDGKDEKYFDNASFSTGTIFIGNRQGNTSMSNTNTLDDYNSIDIIAHEYTHGVVQSTSNLKYYGESGALNESFADIFGNLVEIYTEGLQSNSWLMGEDASFKNTTTLGTGAIRDMANPKNYNDPNTLYGRNWWDTNVAGDDNAGVHNNSGVQNYFFYLLYYGGKGVNDTGYYYDVTGVGIDVASFLAYTVLNTLTPTSNYADAKIAWMTIAELYYGKCSPTFLTVREAWNAVGVNFGEVVSYCDLAANTDLNLNNFYSNKKQLTFGGVKSDSSNCETQLSNSGTKPHHIINAGKAVIINSNTTITAGSKFLIQVNGGDPCEW